MINKFLRKLSYGKKLTVGMIGMGFISNIHIETFQLRKDVFVKAICDNSQSLLSKKSKELKIPEMYPNYHFMLKDKEIDVVDVMTPHYLHKENVRDALKAGKVVICEKPLATSVKEVEEIMRVSRSTRKKVFLKQYLRFSTAYQKARQLLEKGIIGTPYLATCVFTGNSVRQYQDPLTWRGNLLEAGGGVFTDIGVHILDLLQIFFGRPLGVYAETRKVSGTLPTKGEDLAAVLLDYPNKMLVSLGCTHNDTGFRFRWEIRIYGRAGVMTIIDNKGKQEKTLQIIKENKVVYKFSERDWWRQANSRALNNIIDRIKKNGEPAVSLADAKYGIKTIEAVYRSARLGKKILL